MRGGGKIGEVTEHSVCYRSPQKHSEVTIWGLGKTSRFSPAVIHHAHDFEYIMQMFTVENIILGNS